MKKIIGIFSIIVLFFTITLSYASHEDDAQSVGIPLVKNQTTDDMPNILTNGVEENTVTDVAPIVPEPEEVYDYDSLETINDDYCMVNENIQITKNIDGNVFAIGKYVKIDHSFISGNVFAICEDLEITNTDIDGSIFTIAKKAHFDCSAYDYYVLGEDVTLDYSNYCWRNVKLAASNLNVNGYIGRNIYALTEKLNVAKSSTINGKLAYFESTNANIEGDSVIGSTEVLPDVKAPKEEVKEKNSISKVIRTGIGIILKTLILSVFLVYVVKKSTPDKTNIIVDSLKNFGIGILAFIFIPVLSVLLILTLVGASIGVILLFLYFILIIIAETMVSLYIARNVLNKMNKNTNENLILASIIVALILFVITSLPIIGILIGFVVDLIGFGMAVRLFFPNKPKEDKEVINEK